MQYFIFNYTNELSYNMIRLFKFFDTRENFEKKKISASSDDSSYIDPISKLTISDGTSPDISWKNIVFIALEKQIWTHGIFFYEESVNDLINALDSKVDKNGNKGLSSNDFSNDYKDKLDSISENAEENVFNSITIDGTNTDIISKNIDILPIVSEYNDTISNINSKAESVFINISSLNEGTLSFDKIPTKGKKIDIIIKSSINFALNFESYFIKLPNSIDLNIIEPNSIIKISLISDGENIYYNII